MPTKEQIAIWDSLYGRPIAKSAIVAVWQLKRLSADFPCAAPSIHARIDAIKARFGTHDLHLRFGR